MIICMIRRRNFSVSARESRRFQPFTMTHHMERPRLFRTDINARNLLPHHKKLVEQNDEFSENELMKERTLQVRKHQLITPYFNHSCQI